MNGRKVIELKEVTFQYRNAARHFRKVLDCLDFSFSLGQRVGLYGPNGSGKTTLFHLIMGLLRPVSGEVVLFGKNRCKEDDFYEVRTKIGLLFQDSEDQLFCPTVAEDISFGPLNVGKSHEQALAIVGDVCHTLGLGGFENRITHELSSGEKRLVSLATVVALSPEVLLLDEPTTGLDADTIKRLKSFLLSSSSSHIIISHDVDFMKSVTDEIVYLKDGKLGR